VPFIFFLSGVSGLIFETVWFRQTGITFGNSVWASAIALSRFMAGLAAGQRARGAH
jgi:spermidine synthase